MILTASSLRKNIYRILDKISETGIPVEIERKGKKLKIIASGEVQKLPNLKRKSKNSNILFHFLIFQNIYAIYCTYNNNFINL